MDARQAFSEFDTTHLRRLFAVVVDVAWSIENKDI